MKKNFEFYISDQTLLKQTPSREDDIDEDTENSLRIYGCELIQDASILLSLPQTVPTTAQALLQKFYVLRSLYVHDIRDVTMACFFLAAKLEENEKSINSVIVVFNHLFSLKSGKLSQPLDTHSPPYWQMKETIVEKEKEILKALGFNIYVDHPHKYIFPYLKALQVEDTKLMQNVWNFINDSGRTMAIVKYKPQTIAAACIYLSSRFLNIGFPDGWWNLCDASFVEIEDISLSILKLYQITDVKYLSPEDLDDIATKK